MKALFCTDGSKISFNAIYNFAKWSPNTQIDTICIIDWDFLPENIDIEQSDFNMSCSNLADNILERTQKELKSYGLNLGKSLKMCGNVANLIIEELNIGNYDAVLMGSHGKKGLQKWLGSISYDVMNHANVSSFISKHRNNAERILISINDKNNTIENIINALEAFELSNKQIHICMVNENPNLLFLEGTLDSNWFLKIEQEQKKYSYRLIKQLEQQLSEKGLTPFKSVIISGNPAQEVINYCNTNKIDLVILDETNNETRSKLLASQTTKRITENVECDVLVIKRAIKES